MTRVCSYCKQVFGHKPGPDELTHGICKKCLNRARYDARSYRLWELLNQNAPTEIVTRHCFFVMVAAFGGRARALIRTSRFALEPITDGLNVRLWLWRRRVRKQINVPAEARRSAPGNLTERSRPSLFS